VAGDESTVKDLEVVKDFLWCSVNQLFFTPFTSFTVKGKHLSL
jgi:hypothetical protein